MSLLTVFESIVKRLPAIKAIISERDRLRRECGFVPPGHFYSPIPSWDEIRREEASIFGSIPRSLEGIDLREAEQLALLKSFQPYYDTMPFDARARENLRYYFENPSYSYSDAIFLHCMIRYAKPRRIIEIGSGFSSCVTLDTAEIFFDNAIAVTFIEPYPDLLISLLKPGDRERIAIIPQALQKVEKGIFLTLQPDDILFVDSTHVSRINSDVNRIFFEILPLLSPGVYIHFHDIFFPFEYPREYVFEGRAWNEMYLLRAFLQYNSGFKILLMNTFMERFYRPFFLEKMPLCLKNPGGSIWLRKTAGHDGETKTRS